MSECAHKQLKKQMVGEQCWYVCECGQKFRIEPWDGKVPLREPGADTGTTPKDRMYIPRSIPVTDDGLDAPDGAEYTVTFKRVGGAWERIDVAAKRGTTPPPDVWTCEACGYKSDDIGEYREVCGKCFSAAAERGTTPPEGLESALRGVMPFMRYQSVFDYDAYQAAIAEVSRVLAATQRAPVEQGPKLTCQKCGREYDLQDKYADRDFCSGVCHNAFHAADDSYKNAAPDHAREGALTKGGAALARCTITYDQPEEFPSKVKIFVFGVGTGVVSADALADGKEGGE